MESRKFQYINSMLRFQRKAAAAYDACIAEASSKVGLSKPEADVLLFLANNPSCSTARDAAKYRGFSKTYVSRAVERLIARGFLRSEPHPTDGRVLLLHMTGDASQTVRQLQMAQMSFFDRLFVDITSEDRLRVMQLCAKLEENLEWL